jgi:copper transport protein
MALLWAHLAAAVAWLGAAPAVLLVVRDAGAADAEAVDVVRRFSTLAGVVLLIVGGAGLLLAWDLSDGLASGLLTPWTLLLGAKVACVAGAAALGAWGRRHLGRDPERQRLARLFAFDASLLVAIALLSATLTLTGPHTGHAGPETAGDPRCTATVGDASLSLVVAPGRAGTNEVVVGVPTDVEGVTHLLGHELIRAGC